ncbi:MAG: GAF domain-containing protein [Candidatus Methanofastidiosia archaeon]
MREIESIHKILISIQGKDDLNEILDDAVRGIVYGLNFDGAAIGLIDDAEKSFRVVSFYSKRKILRKLEKLLGKKMTEIRYHFKKSRNLSFEKVLKGDMVLTEKLEEIAVPPLSKTVCLGIEKLVGARTYIFLPLVAEEKTVGGLFASSTRGIGRREREALETFSKGLGIAIERVRLYAAIKESEEKYKGLVESSLFGIAIAQEERLVFVNETFLDIFGYKSFDEVNGKNIEIFIAPEDRDMVLNRARRRESGKDILSSYEFKGLRKDGKKIDVEIFSKKIFFMGKSAIQTSFRDVTERKKMEKELRESEERYRNLFENVNDAIFFLAKDGCFPITNPKTTELTGYSREELKRTHFQKLVHPKDLEMMVEGFKNVMSGKYAPKHYEFRVVRKDGKIVDVEANFRRQEMDGEIIGTLCVLRDVTERKEMENKLKTLYQLGQELELSLDLNEISEKVLDACEKVLDFKMIAIFLIDEETQELYIKAQREYPKDIWNFRLSLKEGRGITTWVAKNGKPVIVPDILRDSRYVEGDPRVKSELAVPIKFRGKVLGVLNAESEELDAYDEKDLELLQILASYTGTAMENARLFEEIKNTKDYLENIVESAAEAVIALDTKGRILTFNRGAEIIMRYKAFEVIGKSVLNYYPEGVAKKVMKELRKSRDGKIVGYETSVLGKNNEEIPISLCATLLYNAEGEVIGSLGIFRDLREKKEMEEKINAIYKLSREMSLSLDLEKIFKLILKTSKKVLEFHNSVLLLLDEKENELCVKSMIGYTPSAGKERFPMDGSKGVIGWVGMKGKSLLVPDVRKDKRYFKAYSKTRSELCVPIKIRGKVIGVLNFESEKLNAFTKKDKMLAETLASQVAIAIENAKLFSEKERKFKELKVLNDIGRALISTLKMDQVLELIYEQTTKLMDTTNFFLTLFDEKTKKFDVVLSVENGKKMPKFSFELGKGLMSRVVKTKKPLLVGDYLAECEKFGIEPVGEKKSKAWLSVPLVVKDKVIGVLNVHSHEKRDIYTKENLEILSAIANQAAIAIENAKLYENLQEDNKELELLQRINNVINTTQDLDKILQFIVDNMRKTFNYDVILITFLDEDSKHLILKNISIDSRKFKRIEKFTGLKIEGFKIPLHKESLYYKLAAEGKTIQISDLKRALEDFSDRKSLKRLAGGVKRILGNRFVVAVPLKSQDKIIGTIGITNRKRIGDEEVETLKRFAEQIGLAIKKAMLFEEVAQSNRLMDLFISIMSHDLKNPLTTILGYAELLEDLVDEGVKKYLEKIIASSRKMNRLINNARLYSKIKQKGYMEEFGTFNLLNLMRESISELESKALEKSIIMDFQHDGENFEIEANATLKNAFSNLIDNALKYSPEGSRIEVLLKETQNSLMASVKDSGPCVSDELKEVIFEKFERGKISGIIGSGLGLAIVKGVVEMHQGRVWVEDNPEGGSIFFVDIPKSRRVN